MRELNVTKLFLFCLIFLELACTANSGNYDLQEGGDSSNKLQGEEEVISSTDLEEKDNEEEEVSEILIEWKAPAQEKNVSRYLIRYGTEVNALSKEIEIELEDLEAINHESFGMIYRYVLKGLPSKKVIYYTLQAGNDVGFSSPTPIAKEESR